MKPKASRGSSAARCPVSSHLQATWLPKGFSDRKGFELKLKHFKHLKRLWYKERKPYIHLYLRFRARGLKLVKPELKLLFVRVFLFRPEFGSVGSGWTFFYEVYRV